MKPEYIGGVPHIDGAGLGIGGAPDTLNGDVPGI